MAAMRVGDLNAGIAKLETAMDSLQAARRAAAEHWDDQVFEEFQERYFLPLEMKFHRALDAARRLAHVLERAQHECGPE